jgi:hypothetical protein
MSAAAVYSGVRGFRQNRRRVSQFRRTSRVFGYLLAGIAALFAANLAYQVVRKPGEIFAPVSASMAKNPDLTWRNYGAIFRRYSTDIMAPELLAAIAQVESEGNPLARTYWRWQWSWNLFDIYRPASSAVGMFQITDGTFMKARNYCIRDHQVMRKGPWHDFRSCWFNSLYARTLPTHATEMTAAYLDQTVVELLAARSNPSTTAQKHKLAAVIHLCGPKRGASFVARGFRILPGERCGDHSLAHYLGKIESMKKRFARLAQR